MTKEIYVDTAKYQPDSLLSYKHHGASGAVVQITVGTSIKAPRASAQIHSAHVNGMRRLFYHYATFGHSVVQAQKEADFACARAKELGYKSIHIFCDWEGQDNNVNGSKDQNTKAILAFMDRVHWHGFTAGLYSSASLLHAKIDSKPIIKKYGSCLWVASYTSMGRIDTPNMNYFPSMDGVCMWQFTDDWKGFNVDASVVVYDVFKLKKFQHTGPYKKQVKTIKRETYEITGENIKIKKV